MWKAVELISPLMVILLGIYGVVTGGISTLGSVLMLLLCALMAYAHIMISSDTVDGTWCLGVMLALSAAWAMAAFHPEGIKSVVSGWLADIFVMASLMAIMTFGARLFRQWHFANPVNEEG